MEVRVLDFRNNVNYDDYDKIVGYERKNLGPIYINEMAFDFYILRLRYKDGSFRDLRAYCECDTSGKLNDDNERELFFVRRLFGKDGLIIKEQRNDYIYLGGLNNEQNSEYRFSRYNRASDGKTMQRAVDEMVINDLLPQLSFENMNEDWDLVDMKYFFHTGSEDASDVFANGLRSQYGNKGRNGFCCLVSTFFPVNHKYGQYNGLRDAAKCYGEATSQKGSNVFIIRIPAIYRGEVDQNGNMYPPLPTHKLIDYESGDSMIIPEIIYGVYNIDSKKFYKNPNYNPKYNPNGLSYDQDAADSVKMIDDKWYEFMRSRIGKTYSELKRMDERKKTFSQICAIYGIDYGGSGSLKGFLGSFGRKK